MVIIGPCGSFFLARRPVETERVQLMNAILRNVRWFASFKFLVLPALVVDCCVRTVINE